MCEILTNFRSQVNIPKQKKLFIPLFCSLFEQYGLDIHRITPSQLINLTHKYFWEKGFLLSDKTYLFLNILFFHSYKGVDNLGRNGAV